MEQIVSDFTRQGWLPLTVVAARLYLAVLLDAIVGFNSGWRDRPVGLRTHILACRAVATAAVMIIEIMHMREFDTDAVRINPMRLV